MTKFNHTCMVQCFCVHGRLYAEALYTVHACWRFDARSFRFRICNVRFVYILRANISITSCFVSVFDRSLIQLTNGINSCYKLQMIDIVPLYFTLLQHCNTGFRFSSLHRCSLFDNWKSLIWQSIFIIFITRKFPWPNIRFCIRWVDQCRLWLWCYFWLGRQIQSGHKNRAIWW
jgi:hypothetical protein